MNTETPDYTRDLLLHDIRTAWQLPVGMRRCYDVGLQSVGLTSETWFGTWATSRRLDNALNRY